MSMNKELQRHVKMMRGMAKVLEALSDEVSRRGFMDDTDIGTLKKVGSKLLFAGVSIPFTQTK